MPDPAHKRQLISTVYATPLMTPTTALGLSIRLSMFELRETGSWDTFLGPLERARAETGGADQWVSRLKRRALPGFARVNQVTSASLRYPLSVFNINSILKVHVTASDIVKAESSGEDPKATRSLVSNLPHPRVIKTKQHTLKRSIRKTDRSGDPNILSLTRISSVSGMPVHRHAGDACAAAIHFKTGHDIADDTVLLYTSRQCDVDIACAIHFKTVCHRLGQCVSAQYI